MIEETNMNTIHNNSIDIRPYQRANKHISVGKTMGKILLKIKEARVRRQTIRELESLNDAQLEDIGIPRGQIRRTVMAISSPNHKHRTEYAVGAQRSVSTIRKETGYAKTNQRIAA